MSGWQRLCLLLALVVWNAAGCSWVECYVDGTLSLPNNTHSCNQKSQLCILTDSVTKSQKVRAEYTVQPKQGQLTSRPDSWGEHADSTA